MNDLKTNKLITQPVIQKTPSDEIVKTQYINPDIANIITWVLVFIAAFIAHKSNEWLHKKSIAISNKKNLLDKSNQLLQELKNIAIDYWLSDEDHPDCKRLSVRLRIYIDDLDVLLGEKLTGNISKLRMILTDRDFEVPTRVALNKDDRLFTELNHEIQEILKKLN